MFNGLYVSKGAIGTDSNKFYIFFFFILKIKSSNNSYFFEGAEWKAMKTNLPHIIHFADSSAARQEKETFMLSGESRIDFPKYMKGESQEEELVKNLDVSKLKGLFEND